MLLRRSERDIHDQPAPKRDHGSGCQLARVIVGTHTSIEHRIPAPKRLFPEWLAPREYTVFHHLLVAAPNIVDENVDGASLLNARECSCDLFILSVVATNSCDLRVASDVVVD